MRIDDEHDWTDDSASGPRTTDVYPAASKVRRVRGERAVPLGFLGTSPQESSSRGEEEAEDVKRGDLTAKGQKFRKEGVRSVMRILESE